MVGLRLPSAHNPHGRRFRSQGRASFAQQPYEIIARHETQRTGQSLVCDGEVAVAEMQFDCRRMIAAAEREPPTEAGFALSPGVDQSRNTQRSQVGGGIQEEHPGAAATATFPCSWRGERRH